MDDRLGSAEEGFECDNGFDGRSLTVVPRFSQSFQDLRQLRLSFRSQRSERREECGPPTGADSGYGSMMGAAKSAMGGGNTSADAPTASAGGYGSQFDMGAGNTQADTPAASSGFDNVRGAAKSAVSGGNAASGPLGEVTAGISGVNLDTPADGTAAPTYSRPSGQ